MDFIDALQTIAAKIAKQKDVITTEEGTKNAFIMPFIEALGYDVFDPDEVIPEFTADVGIKKGEKVDYAIKHEGKIVMLIECKCCNTPLKIDDSSQLYRYFSVTAARIAILTDGIVYRFYTDIEAPNRMDPKPFMEFDLLNRDESLIAELKRLTKQSFNLEAVLTVASELKYTREMKRILGEQLTTPSDDFVRLLVSEVYSGKLTSAVKEQFRGLARQAFSQFINERITERLRSAMDTPPQPSGAQPEMPLPGEVPGSENRIVTTEDERQAYYIVKAIVCSVLNPSRIVFRDALSYFGILCDDNNRKPICRLYFNRKQKYIALMDANKNEERVPIDALDDIYKLADQLLATAESYAHV